MWVQRNLVSTYTRILQSLSQWRTPPVRKHARFFFFFFFFFGHYVQGADSNLDKMFGFFHQPIETSVQNSLLSRNSLIFWTFMLWFWTWIPRRHSLSRIVLFFRVFLRTNSSCHIFFRFRIALCHPSRRYIRNYTQADDDVETSWSLTDP